MRKRFEVFGISVLVSGFLSGVNLGTLGYAEAGMNVSNHLSAGGSMTLTNQTLESVSVGHNLTLTQSQVHGNIAVGHMFTCTDCKIDGNVSAGHALNLLRTNIGGNASVGHQAQITNTTIEGTLSTGSTNLTLKNAKVGSIHINDDSGSVNSAHINMGVRNNSVVGNNNISIHNGTMTTTKRGQSVINIGGNGVSSINGYTVKSTADVTTVMTPDNTVYQNGKRASAIGPKTYADYRASHPEAPIVQGPGWSDNSAGSNSTAIRHEEATSQIQLTERSIVTGDIVFEGGHGKVLLSPGSQFNGKLIGGKLEKLR